MEQFIKATPKNKKDIMAKFDTSLETVSRALNFETNSYLAQEIRSYALQLGCKLMVEAQYSGSQTNTIINQMTTTERAAQ